MFASVRNVNRFTVATALAQRSNSNKTVFVHECPTACLHDPSTSRQAHEATEHANAGRPRNIVEPAARRDSVLKGWSAPAPAATGCRGGAAGPGPPAPTAAPASPSQPPPPPPSTTMTTPSTRPSLPCRAAAPRSAGSSSHQIHQADLKIKSKENKVRDRSRGSLSHERNKENAEEKSFVEREV